MLRYISGTVNKTVLTATLRLPRFEPSHHNGQLVAVRLAMPVVINIC